MSTNLSKRSAALEHEYCMPGVNLRLIYYVNIDPTYLSSAENEVKQYFTNAGWGLNHAKHKELVVLAPQMIKTVVHDKYQSITVAYKSKLLDLQTQLDALKQQLIERDERLKEKDELIAVYKSLAMNHGH